MTEHINLETVDAYLASIILPQGNMLPSPLVVISDDTPLYDEPGILHEMEAAMAEDRPAKINAEIIDIEVYSESLITVTFASVNLEATYRVNVPRQLMQVGYMYNRLLNTSACAIITESEAQMNKDFNEDDGNGERLPPFNSEDIMVRMSFPKDMPQSTRLAYNYILNNIQTDLTEDISNDELREIAPKVRLIAGNDESRALRGRTIELLLGLVEGQENAVVSLYELAQHTDAAKESLAKNALLTQDERDALLMLDYIIKVTNFVNPEALINQLYEIEHALNPRTSKKAEIEEESSVDMDDLLSEDFQSSLNEIITEFRQENPETVTLNEDSTYAERVEYISLASNLVPLMGGLLKLSDKINTEMYYSRDWNVSVITEDDYGTVGELFIVLSMLAVQRIHMFGKSVDVPESPQDMKSLTLSWSIEALTHKNDIELWYFKYALDRAAQGKSDALLEFLIMSITGMPADEQSHGTFGQIMHWMGHIMTEEEHTRAEMLQLFSNMPIMSEFVETLYDDADSISEDDDIDIEELDEDEAVEECYVSNACIHLPYVESEPNVDLAKEATQALILFAAHCLEGDDPDVEKGTPEWIEAMSIYLNRVLTDED